MLKRTLAVVLLGGAFASSSIAQAQLQDTLRGALDGARQGAANTANQAINDALGVPNQPYNRGNNPLSVPDPNRLPDETLPRARPDLDAYTDRNRANANFDYSVPGQMTPQMRNLGMRPGDTVVDQFGNVVRSPSQMQRALNAVGPNARIERSGQTVRIVQASSGNNRVTASSGERRRLGIRMEPNSNAVVVAAVSGDSPAGRAGLRAGDRIVSINGRGVRDPNLLSADVNAVEGNQATFLIDRAGRQQEVIVFFVEDDGYVPARPARPAPPSRASLEQRVDELEQHVGHLLGRLDELEAAHAKILEDHQRLEAGR